MFRLQVHRLLVLLLAVGLSAIAQSPAGPRHPHGELQAVKVATDQFGPVIEIAATRPVVPKLQVVQDPLRLVIDLPDSILVAAKKKIPFRNDQIKSIRLNQYQSSPPVTRIVVDLAAPVQYTWDALGTQLRIRIRPDQAAAAKPPSVPAFTSGVQPAAVPVAIGNSGTLVEVGSRVAAGSSITAGEETAVLRLTRGGEVRVCPGTTVSVATSPTGNDLMLGLSSGAMETHYGLSESVDSVLTPDFRVVLPGPGEFNLAIRADAHGNTCVGSMNGSNASAVVAELLGSGTYEVKPGQQVLFRQGRLESVETPVASCGCPPALEPVLRASADPSQVVPESEAGQKLKLENSADASPLKAPPSASPMPDSGQDTKPAEAAKKPDVESSLVFSGTEIAEARQRSEAAAAAKKVPDAPTTEAAKLPLTSRSRDPLPAVVVLPPAPEPKNKGFFGKVKGFFGGIFH